MLQEWKETSPSKEGLTQFNNSICTTTFVYIASSGTDLCYKYYACHIYLRLCACSVGFHVHCQPHASLAQTAPTQAIRQLAIRMLHVHFLAVTVRKITECGNRLGYWSKDKGDHAQHRFHPLTNFSLKLFRYVSTLKHHITRTNRASW